jgi:FKBP-type peptidyl-prolyl cis-trans isomerase SlyD
MLGKIAGEPFDFKIEAENGYGLVQEDYIVKIDKSAFMVDGNFDAERVNVGNELEMNDADGNILVGLVVEITDEHVTMDFNHPLAGHNLHFKGKILEVREATPDEISHGHVHGPGGHHH